MPDNNLPLTEENTIADLTATNATTADDAVSTSTSSNPYSGYDPEPTTDLWGQTQASDTAHTGYDPEPSTDLWGQTGSADSDSSAADWLNPEAAASSSDWLAAGASDQTSGGFQLHQLWDGSFYSSAENGINQGIQYLTDSWRPFFQLLRVPIDYSLLYISDLFQNSPILLMIAILSLVAWQLGGGTLAIGTLLSLCSLVVLGIWQESMLTLSLVLNALVFCVMLGLPLGVLVASSKHLSKFVRPLLDAMQTTPSFVYLVPIVSLFGIGNVPGTIVTIIFALPPMVRMTDLGIRQVRPDLIEASNAYGASTWQLLTQVQLPLALPSIMAGINQSLMLAMSMVVVASMISVAGLGQMVYEGMGSMNMGKATIGGAGIVILAIVLDRITQTMMNRSRSAQRWWQTGPIGLLVQLLSKNKASK